MVAYNVLQQVLFIVLWLLSSVLSAIITVIHPGVMVIFKVKCHISDHLCFGNFHLTCNFAVLVLVGAVKSQRLDIHLMNLFSQGPCMTDSLPFLFSFKEKGGGGVE